ncbi:Hypothetical protein FKW44_000018, partial [Caligus rogercresseyi]
TEKKCNIQTRESCNSSLVEKCETSFKMELKEECDGPCDPNDGECYQKISDCSGDKAFAF